MDNTKQELITNVKEWLTLEEEIKILQKQMREKRKRKKELNEMLINIMKANDIECFDTNNGKLLHVVNKAKKPLTKKFLISTLENYYQNDIEKAKELSEFILNNRNESITETIKHKDS